MSQEQRKDERLNKEEKVYIEVLSSSDDTTDDNLMLACTTRDISKSGLKIQSSYPFIINSILELLINFESGGYKFLLTGEVKWLENLQGEQYIAGFELVEAEHSDIIVWQKMFSEENAL